MLHQPAEFPCMIRAIILTNISVMNGSKHQQDYQEFREPLILRGYNAIVIVSQFRKIAIMFDARNIRSRDAVFDPAKAAVPYLMA
jgi:hypothetical protein